jgi:glycosyltransferase involved in cell wall biosynthesis
MLAQQRQRAEITGADYLLVPSEFARRTYLKAGVAPERVWVVPNGASLRRFRPALPPDAVSTARFRVLFVGNGFLRKGLVYLLEAVRRLGLPDLELVVVGLPLRGGDWLLARYRGLFEHLTYVPPERLPQLYRSADVFALPSLAEGSALVVYQALACGLPVVTTEHAGSIVRDGRDGFLVPLRDTMSLAECLHALHGDALLRREMGESAACRAQCFGWERYHGALGTLYHRMIGIGRGERAASEAAVKGVA